jgi:hypothetical protein
VTEQIALGGEAFYSYSRGARFESLTDYLDTEIYRGFAQSLQKNGWTVV